MSRRGLRWLKEEKRQPIVRQIVTVALSLLAALLVSSTVLMLLGASPVIAMRAVFEGAFGSNYSIGTTIAKTAPLLLAGVGITFALSAGLFNIGAEGQIYIGGLAAAWTVLTVSVPGPLAILLGLAAGVIGGAVWCGVAGLLRAKRGVSEVITTLLLNYVAIQIVLWAVSGPMRDPTATFPRSADVPSGALLPKLLVGTQGHIGLVFGVLLALLVAWVLRYTHRGFQIRALADTGSTPRYVGMPVDRLVILVLGVSGGMAGLAGAVEVLGVHRRLIEGFSPGYGFDAIAVALLARGNPVAVIPAALLFGVLRGGANAMQRATGVPASMVFVVQATAVLFVVAGYSIEALIRRKKAVDVAKQSQTTMEAVA